MKKYLVLAVLPLFASCSHWDSCNKSRPTAEADRQAKIGTDIGLYYPHRVVDQTATSALDITEDSADYVSHVSRKQTRKYAGTVTRSANRGSRIVANETRRFTNTAYDIADDTADVGVEAIDTYPNLVLDASDRTMGVGGKFVGAGVRGYTNVVHRTAESIFGNLFKGAVVDTRPYMVGSANDQWPVAGMPGSSWKGCLPRMEAQEVQYHETTSGKAVTSVK